MVAQRKRESSRQGHADLNKKRVWREKHPSNKNRHRRQKVQHVFQKE